MKTVLVAIGGASSSGKTTLAKLLHKVVPHSYLLHQDDFFKNDKDIPIDPKTGLENWDCVGALNFDEFVRALKHLKRTGSISSNVSRYESDTKDQDLSIVPQSVISTLQEQLKPLVEDRKLVLIDGFMLFHDPKIIRLFDLRIFVRSSYKTLKTRRRNRSGYQTADSLWVDPPNYFDDIVYPAYAESHAHLFTNGDVESNLDGSKLQKFDILAINNEDGTNLSDALITVCEFIVNRLQDAV